MGRRHRRPDSTPCRRLGRALREGRIGRRHGRFVGATPPPRSPGPPPGGGLVRLPSGAGATGPKVSEQLDEPAARPRIAYLSYSTGEFDARTFRMAASAIESGWDVTVYARWQRGLEPVEERDGYRLIRVPREWRYLVPVLRRRARRRYRAAIARTPSSRSGAARPDATGGGTRVRRIRFRPLERWHWWQRIREFPLQPMGWAIALDDVVEPADVWHGMWAGSLPALDRMRHHHGGRTVYDSRDIFMRSR